MLDFLRGAGVFHPRAKEENEKNERLARQEEEREKKIREEDLRRMMKGEVEKRPPKGPPPVAPPSPKAEPARSSRGRMREPPQTIGAPPIREEVMRWKAIAEAVVKEPPSVKEPPGASGIPPTRLAKSEPIESQWKAPSDTPWKIPPTPEKKRTKTSS